MQRDPARIEHLLDHGWFLIGQLHRWLSKWPLESTNRDASIDLIRGLQLLWAKADDLDLKRLARNSLALEQFLERFCARKLEFTSEHLKDMTAGIGSLLDLLLGFEATCEEPALMDVESLQKLERHALQGFLSDEAQTTIEILANAHDVSTALVRSIPIVMTPAPVPSIAESRLVQDQFGRSLLAMLEQFVVKVDETCHRLHARVLADKAPYFTTTSRLEYLAQSTRELVEQMTHQSLESALEKIDEPSERLIPWLSLEVSLPRLEDSPPLLAVARSTHEVLHATTLEERNGAADNESQSVQELSIVEYSLSRHRQEHANVRPRLVLIVEESLFYRHLIGLALQSAGYESLAVESMASGLDALGQSPQFCAILVSSTMSPEMSHVIERSRSTQGTKVIGLTMPDPVEFSAVEFDAQVAKSQPAQLIAVLNRLLNSSSDEPRKIA